MNFTVLDEDWLSSYMKYQKNSNENSNYLVILIAPGALGRTETNVQIPNGYQLFKIVIYETDLEREQESSRQMPGKSILVKYSSTLRARNRNGYC